MVQRQERGALRIEGEAGRVLGHLASAQSAPPTTVRAPRRGATPWTSGGPQPPAALMLGYLADFCGRKGGGARASTERWLRGRVWDINMGPLLDLTLQGALKKLRNDATSGALRAAALAPECKYWSRVWFLAEQIRSSASPWGLPSLSSRGWASLVWGNRSMWATVLIIRILIKFGVPYALEHLAGSSFWNTPEVAGFLRHRCVRKCVIYQCASRPTGAMVAVHVTTPASDMSSLSENAWQQHPPRAQPHRPTRRAPPKHWRLSLWRTLEINSISILLRVILASRCRRCARTASSFWCWSLASGRFGRYDGGQS